VRTSAARTRWPVEGIHRRCHDVLIHSLRLTVELAVAIITGASESRATTRWLPVTTGWLPRSHPLKVAPHKGFSRSSDYGDYGDYRGEISSCIQPMQQGTATRARWRIPAALTRTRLRYCTGDPPAAMAPSVVGDYRWLRGDYRVVTRSNPLHIRLSADRVTKWLRWLQRGRYLPELTHAAAGQRWFGQWIPAADKGIEFALWLQRQAETYLPWDMWDPAANRPTVANATAGTAVLAIDPWHVNSDSVVTVVT